MTAVRTILRVGAAAGLWIDAGVHAQLAGRYDAVSAAVSEGTLFRVESGAAALAVVLVLAWRRPLGDLFAALTAGAGLAAILVYRYVDVGTLGPLPDMYEPVWFTDKVWALAGQALALGALVALLSLRGAAHRPVPA
ncbi:hypothetical protein [Streptacidiphilus sp. P02-A3a]|uniref:hypothetical protein n=1 Tax=Streptacidiphilus sp. P02-A3a TaxID=2704468 RepID=UPI0015FE5B56|nr:hypothetical protein [Streptacidiphilus sp. P02-A3a]QMU69375.1 hypothetical protein GXP74_15160 [Streptacidiphilus sp. P02-A3a]